jgi:NAD-dependent histone deacetylase SIR2
MTGRECTISDNQILILQVRAFLEASEDVDIDAGTVEDLIETINQNADHLYEEASNEGDRDGDGDGDGVDENVNLTEGELDVSALFSIEDEGNHLMSLKLESRSVQYLI